MYQTVHEFRKMLDSGRICLGSSVTLSDIAVSEALGPSVDFLWIDLEHNPIGFQSLLGHLVAARATGTAALVRVPSSEKSIVKRTLDVGAPAVIAPQVRSAEEVRRFVQECRYPPEGLRGFGPRRGCDYGRLRGSEYLKEANRGVFVVAQIERMAAVEELEAILAIEGLDSIVLGPNDLAHDMGYAGDEQHPQVMNVIEQIVTKARQAGLYVGMGTGMDKKFVAWAAGIGVQWIQPGSDCLYMVAKCNEVCAEIRQELTGG